MSTDAELDPVLQKQIHEEMARRQAEGEANNAPPQYREVTVPIPTENIKEFFTNKSIFFMANHSKSRLKGATFLTYLSNLAVPSDITFDSPMAYEEYAMIMDAYMKQRMVSSTRRLHVMMAQLVLWAKGVPYKDIPYQTGVPEAFMDRFVRELNGEHPNAVRIMKWMHFIDSSMIFAISSIKVLDDKYQVKEKFEVIEDKEYVGHNVVNLYAVPYFTELYFAVPRVAYRMSYFTHQYEDYMFSNQRLAHYFDTDNNFIQILFTGIAMGTVDEAELDRLLGLPPEGEKSGTQN